MKRHQEGFIWLPVIAVVLGLLLVGGVYVYVQTKAKTQTTLGIATITVTGETQVDQSSIISVNTASTSPKYLLFQLFTLAPTPSGQDGLVTSKAGIDDLVSSLLSSLGSARGDHVTTQLGFTVGPLAFDMTDDQLRAEIDNAFAVAEEKDIAVAFHIDDSMFWNVRKDLWSDKNNIEWTDWSGTTQPHRIIGWIDNGQPILAPQMCFNSSAIVAETTRIARDVIGAEIKKNVDYLNTIGKPYLFAGVITGWETRIQDDSTNPVVYYGYCALHNLGYSASNPPADMDKALEGVVSGWIVLWDKSLEAAGVSKTKVYTHIADAGDYTANVISQLKNLYPNPSAVRDFYKDAPPGVAFNAYSYPGFSIYDGEGTIFTSLYNTLASHASTPWGISEGTALGVSDAVANSTTGSASAMEQYLARAFNHGAIYVNIFGWSSSAASAGSGVTTSSASIGAYKKFLNGGQLSSVSPATSPAPITRPITKSRTLAYPSQPPVVY